MTSKSSGVAGELGGSPLSLDGVSVSAMTMSVSLLSCDASGVAAVFGVGRGFVGILRLGAELTGLRLRYRRARKR